MASLRVVRALARAGACALALASADAHAVASSLLEAAEGAAHVVVGAVGSSARVDLHGFEAALVVERSLRGDAEAGATLRVAWEQFDPDRPSRFRAGQRWLLALDPLPGGSLWRERFPGASAPGGRPVWVVAERSTAALPDPDAASVDGLAAWLALAPGERTGSAGARALAGMAERAQPALAADAVRRLDALPELRARLDGSAGATLARALWDPARPEAVRRALAELAARRRLDVLRPALEALAGSPSPLRADALAALARLDGGLTAERARALLADPDPRVRAVAVAESPALDTGELDRLARGDRDPEVRAAAIEALAARAEPRAMDAAAGALLDDDPQVRAAALRAIARRGAAAVPVLRERAFAGSGPEAAAATAALALTGRAGREALEELAERHPDEAIRRAARFTLGRDQPH